MDFIFNDDGTVQTPGQPNALQKSQEKVTRSRGTKTHEKQFYRRFLSERELEEIIDWDFEPGYTYHIISSGDIDSLSYLKMILRQQKLDYLLLSTWCMALQDIEEIERYLRIGRIKRMDCYVGEIFKGTYANEFIQLCRIMDQYGGRVCVFRNHSKVFAGFGERFDFAVESSANINTNPRTENTAITINRELALFYKDFYDGIHSFERNFDSWNKYELG